MRGSKDKTLKIRRIGNSLGATFPASWGLNEGDIIPYDEKEDTIRLQLHEAAINHDRELIEKDFASFEKGLTVSDQEMTDRFGKYGWS